jgi:hypothetical protein
MKRRLFIVAVAAAFASSPARVLLSPAAVVDKTCRRGFVT